MPEPQDYIVQTDDWLSRLSDKFYGDILAYPAIVEATNAKAAQDDSYTFISDPDVIEVGQKLWIPTLAEAELLLADDAEEE
jgi:nucleoid-associated protein YgaU